MQEYIRVVGAKQNNLKNINISIPKNKFIVITGLSGSGKSSLAFDTIYAEGQRRYIESLSSYAKQFMDVRVKPDVESITGLSPAIAIDQKVIGKNPRSTVGTITEIYDYLRILFARIGVPYSPTTNKPLQSQTPDDMLNLIMSLPLGTEVNILAPVIRDSRGEHVKDLIRIRRHGFGKLKIDGIIYDVTKSLPRLDKTTRHNVEIVLGTIKIEEKVKDSLLNKLHSGLENSNGIIYVEIVKIPPRKQIVLWGNEYENGDIIKFSKNYFDPDTGITINSIEPKMFSFNSPFGTCSACDGLGTRTYFNPDLIIMDKTLTIRRGAIETFKNDVNGKLYIKMLEKLGKIHNFSIDSPYSSYNEETRKIILYGTDDELDIEQETDLTTVKINAKYEGVINILEKKFEKVKDEMIRDELSKYRSLRPCDECGGYRLNRETLSIKIDKKHIGDICNMSMQSLLVFLEDLPNRLTETEKIIASKVIEEIVERIKFLINVGLDYLTLSRESGSLSGGESQRIRLATQVSTGLSGVLYVLDEPSIGLHQSDNQRLIVMLKKLRDLGNTVIVVEHDEETMLAADWLIDIGPGAGKNGGYVVAEGYPDKVLNNPNSITGAYLKGEKTIPIPPYRRKWLPKKSIKINGARGHNLKNINVVFPTGIFCSVTGVSGGGKSTLVLHTLYKSLARTLNGMKATPEPYDNIDGITNIDKIIQIDQSPIGRTPRSNPCTYIGAFTLIRDLFVETDEAVNRDYKVNRFSFNVKGGRCENCQGDGAIRIEMNFLPDIYIPCPICNGKRYNSETLEIKYKDKDISDILNMTVDEACIFFKDIGILYDKFKALKDVGLGYIKIGQSAITLSGGEAQRIKLAKELSKKGTGNTIYILDEPTTGLHSEDIRKLLCVLHRLVEQGNTVIVIEHNLDVIKTSDWIIDIGPQGGDKGGYVVATGTPEDIIEDDNSLTGKYLKIVIDRNKKAISK
ncbi:MAG: excinuclease ABC subunit UvrA [Rickettsiales bacterium]|jgi:excinuclease ABC subunit A|nr:excinuclease ABC subunit UvrA [Rickettsiales bacterium]